MRACDDARDASDVAMEAEIVGECHFTSEEVDGFRQLYSQGVQTESEMKIGKIEEMLKSLDISFTEDTVEKLNAIVRDCNPAHRDAVRFPHFLRLMKKLTTEDTMGVNEASMRVLRRDGTMKSIGKESASTGR